MEEQAFLDAIRINPDDRITRLVYADWLEERGHPLARYIRSECEAEVSPPGSTAMTSALEQMRSAVWVAGCSLGGWEYAPVLNRIRQRLERMRAALGPPASYHRPAPLSEHSLIDFELDHGVMLPGQYRAFLLNIGTEHLIPSGGSLAYPDWSIGRAYFDEMPDLLTPFPYSPSVIELLRRTPVAANGADAGGTVPTRDGCLILAYRDSDNLLLGVNGAARGQVWIDGDLYGPLSDKTGRILSFFDWYEGTHHDD